MARKGVSKERLLQIVSETTQVTILRRVSCFKLQLRDRQEARVRGDGVIDAQPWRRDGVWMRSKN